MKDLGRTGLLRGLLQLFQSSLPAALLLRVNNERPAYAAGDDESVLNADLHNHHAVQQPATSVSTT